MQLGVDRHRDKPGLPDGKEGNPVFRMVLHDQRHPVPGVKAELPPKRSGEPGCLLRIVTVGGDNLLAIGEGRQIRIGFRRSGEQPCDIHLVTPRGSNAPLLVVLLVDDRRDTRAGPIREGPPPW